MQAMPRSDASPADGRDYADANRRLRVLIVDDDDADRLIVRRSLARTNLPLDIREAATGRDGLRQLAEVPFDCLFLDDGLPGTQVAELLEAITAGDSPIVATVLLTDPGHAAAALPGFGHHSQDYLTRSELGVGAVRRALLRAVDTAALLRQLHEQREALAQSERELERFACMTAQQLGAPLDTIVALVGQLERHGGDRLDQRSRDCLDRIVGCSSQLQRAVADIAELGSIGRDDAEFEHCDSGELLRAALAALGPELSDAGVQVTWDRLPAIDCQRRRIVQLFEELLRDAIRHRRAATSEFRISARALAIGAVERLGYAPPSRHRTVWEFRIVDGGSAATSAGNGQFAGVSPAGCPPGDAAGARDGTDLRLAVCRRIVERHRGRMYIEPVAAGGSRVRFTLPGLQNGSSRSRGQEA